MNIVRRKLTTGMRYVFDKDSNIIIFPMDKCSSQHTNGAKNLEEMSTVHLPINLQLYCVQHKLSVLVTDGNDVKLVFNPGKLVEMDLPDELIEFSVKKYKDINLRTVKDKL